MIHLRTPLSREDIGQLKVGDAILLSGTIFCGRDAVLPRITSELSSQEWQKREICLKGGVIFHTAVSCAGVGPTSSNKLEIENSIIPLSKAGIMVHLGKGALKKETILGLAEFGAVYAVIPPVTALLGEKTLSQRCIAWPELGMEALYALEVKEYPAIIAAAHGKSIYDGGQR